ncbi:hypothetical protein DFR56_11062 [Pseudogracilibacillus auburnensis]|uniref:Uncharacterized protein n=1 Tax=Pseudogracilibacillus auburnensis TaxID=1494959 RepID=A0A2V3VUG3_9BACI|nr:hypothetical protein DFR56_11062 [Pseudogracilibacillus auburnensis]
MHLIEPYGTNKNCGNRSCTLSYLHSFVFTLPATSHYLHLSNIFLYFLPSMERLLLLDSLSYLPIANFIAMDCVSLNFHRLFSLTSNKKDEVEPTRRETFSLVKSYSLRKCRMHCKFCHNEHCFIRLNNIFCFKANNCRTFL